MAVKMLIAHPCDAERALLACALERGEYEVLQATGPAAIVEQARIHDLQLIILDTLGWQKQAEEILATLRADESTARIPVMMFGNPREEANLNKALQNGASAWIRRKGFSLEQFLEQVGRIQGKLPAPVNPEKEEAVVYSLPEDVARIDRDAVFEAVGRQAYLPAFSFSITEAVTTTCPREQAVKHIAEIVMRDPMMTADLLALAIREDTTGHRAMVETHEAAAAVGMQNFARLAEDVWPLEYNLAGLWDPGCFWLHSLATARIAGLLSRKLGFTKTNQAFNAGLLHDLGYYILATQFPKHFGTLFSASRSADTIHPVWEKRLIGAHHGEIAAWTMEHLGLPEIYRSVVGVHHVPGVMGQALNNSARIVALMVQAADQLADALFPGDPPLTSLTMLAEDILSVMDRADLEPGYVVDESRKIIADLMTELIYLFPQTASRSYVNKHQPLETMLYYAPRTPDFDLVRHFFETRCHWIQTFDSKSFSKGYPLEQPMVINLACITNPAAQVESLATLVACGLTRDRRGIVLLNGEPEEACRSIVGPTWRFYTLPTQPACWIRWLAGDQESAIDETRVA